MQENRAPENGRRSNAQRREATKAALLAAARTLFTEKGFADTSTPEIVRAANVTRGALYHHFADKTELFLAVAELTATEIAAEIMAVTAAPTSPLQALSDGANAYFDAMAVPGRSRLLLLEAPAVLSTEQLLTVNELAGSRELEAGFAYALAVENIPAEEIAALALLMSAAFDRAAMAIARDESTAAFRAATQFLLERITGH